MFDAIRFFEDYNIEYSTTGENIGRDWVGIDCPRCSDHMKHLGFHLGSGVFSCWKCGKMSPVEAIKRLTETSWREAYRLHEKYGGAQKRRIRELREIEKDIEVNLPNGILDSFPKTHLNYLIKRNFDPEYVINLWNLKATGHLGKYKFRIIIPIYYKNKLVSYMGRDITGRSKTKYKACSTDLEARNHKHCLYGAEKVKSSSLLVVEGMTDVWRMGVNSVALLGINYTHSQLMLLAEYKRIYIYLDETEEQAQEQANKLCNELSALGKEAYHIKINKDCDPADLTQDEARYIMRDLLLK